MALHDVDKASDSRGRPSINVSDTLTPDAAKAHATDSIANRSEDAGNTARIVYKDDQILVYDSSNLRIIFGRLPDGTFGMVVSKEGIDADTLFS